jgi:hypothetical protein
VLPSLELDKAFESKEAIALQVKSALQSTMREFGFEFKQCLVTDLNPDSAFAPFAPQRVSLGEAP